MLYLLLRIELPDVTVVASILALFRQLCEEFLLPRARLAFGVASDKSDVFLLLVPSAGSAKMKLELLLLPYEESALVFFLLPHAEPMFELVCGYPPRLKPGEIGEPAGVTPSDVFIARALAVAKRCPTVFSDIKRKPGMWPV